jgi:serine/threonine-protein phosphatase PGAM5
MRHTRHMKTSIAWLLMLLFACSVPAGAEQAPAARTIVLVRHGQYIEDPSIPENPGPPLSPLGVAQAHLAGARLAGLGMHFDAFYVSPLQRARNTASIIAQDFPGSRFQVLAGLQECTPPTRRTSITDAGKPADFLACKARLDALFAQYFRPTRGVPSTELFVCHGNVIRYLVTRALGVDTRAWLEMSVGHASITRIRVEADGSFKVISVGDVGYLPASMLTGASGDAEHSLAIPSLPLR